MALEYLSQNDCAEAMALLDDIFLEKSKDDLGDSLLAAKLRKRWRKKWTKQIESMIDALEDMPPETHAGILVEIQESMAQALGKEFAEDEEVQKIIKRAVRKAYATGKSLWANESAPVNADSGVMLDERAMQFVRENGCYWIGEFYGAQVQPEIQSTFAEALALGLDADALAARLKENVGKVMGNSHYEYWDIAASSMLVRARAFGNVFGMEEAQITEYEIFAMLDEGTCRICREMDGRRFEVAEAAKTCRRVLEMTDPEKVKAALPWMSAPPVGISSKKLTEGGKMLPPFHGRCRCDTVMHETKTEKTDKAIKKEILQLYPKDKRKQTEIISINQDTRTVVLKEGSYLPKKGLSNWKYDLLDRQKKGIIKERRIYDNLGRIDTEIHLNNHGTPKFHDKPHVHRHIYKTNDPDEPDTAARDPLEKELVSWEKEVVENMPQEMLDKDGDWLWKSIKRLLWKAKKLLRNL